MSWPPIGEDRLRSRGKEFRAAVALGHFGGEQFELMPTGFEEIFNRFDVRFFDR